MESHSIDPARLISKTTGRKTPTQAREAWVGYPTMIAWATRLLAALGTSPEFWLKMQMQYDLWQAQKAKRPRIRRFPQGPKAKGLAVA